MHLLPLAISNKIFSPVEVIYSYQPLYIIVTTLVTVTICAGVIWIARKFLPSNICNNVLG